MSLNLLTQTALSLDHLQELAVSLGRGRGGADVSLGLRGELCQLLELELDLLLVLLLPAHRRTAGSLTLNLRERVELQTVQMVER